MKTLKKLNKKFYSLLRGWFFNFLYWAIWIGDREKKGKHFLKRRSTKHFIQRMDRGFDDSDCWSLDYSLAKIILPRLKRFREITCGAPGCICYNEDGTEKPLDEAISDWEEELDLMIAAFELLADNKKSFCLNKEQEEIVDDGLFSFYYYYRALWY